MMTLHLQGSLRTDPDANPWREPGCSPLNTQLPQNKVSDKVGSVDTRCKSSLVYPQECPRAREIKYVKTKEFDLDNKTNWWPRKNEAVDQLCSFKQNQGNICKFPIAFEFVALLKACASEKDLLGGIRIHAKIVESGLIGKDVYVGNALVNMYAKCGLLSRAEEVFHQLPTQNVVSWTSLINGFVQEGLCLKALYCYDRMKDENVAPTATTFVCILKACGILQSLERGKCIHFEVACRGFLDNNVIIGTALVDMYAKCGALGEAHCVFESLPVKDIFCWTALLSGYANHGHGEEALKCVEDMERKGLTLSPHTFVCILKACGSIGAIDKGKQIHDMVIKDGLLETNALIGTALVEMYARCGEIKKAEEVFNVLPVRDVVSWTALITGYAQLGMDEIVCDAFDEMVKEGIKPDEIILTVVLNACSHLGLLDEGQRYFESISKLYGMTPALEHYTCIVDMFARVGLFDKAVRVIKDMPTSDYLPVWSALLAACQKWGNVSIGRWAFQHAVKLHENDPGTYVSMNHIYAMYAMK